MKKKPTISEALLLDAGYKEFKDTFAGYADKSFQKCVRDEIGKKYFINVNMSDWLKYQAGAGVGWEFEVNINTEKGAVSIRLVQWFNDSGTYSQNTIGDAEKYFENVWQQHGQPYYERDL